MSAKIVKCSVCGVEGEAGEHAGEGRIVPTGGQTFGGRLPADGSVCDKCADKACAEAAEEQD